jgi:hypothetical protein
MAKVAHLMKSARHSGRALVIQVEVFLREWLGASGTTTRATDDACAGRRKQSSLSRFPLQLPLGLQYGACLCCVTRILQSTAPLCSWTQGSASFQINTPGRTIWACAVLLSNCPKRKQRNSHTFRFYGGVIPGYRANETPSQMRYSRKEEKKHVHQLDLGLCDQRLMSLRKLRRVRLGPFSKYDCSSGAYISLQHVTQIFPVGIATFPMMVST